MHGLLFVSGVSGTHSTEISESVCNFPNKVQFFAPTTWTVDILPVAGNTGAGS